MKKFLLTAMISFGAIEASAYSSYLNTTTFGNTSITTGNIGSSSVYITSNRFGNTSSTYGSIGNSSIYFVIPFLCCLLVCSSGNSQEEDWSFPSRPAE